MAYITTEWDYSLKQEVFKVSGDKGYAHTTDIILKRLTDEHGSFEPVTTEYVSHFTAEFTLTVLRDIGSSHISLYDNGVMIPFEYKTTENGTYQSSDGLMEWSDQINNIWIKLDLTYDVDHSIEARYLGNNQGLPSRSLAVPINVPIPDSFVPILTFGSYKGQPVDDEIVDTDPTGLGYPFPTIIFNGDNGVSGKTLKVINMDTGDVRETLTTSSNGSANVSFIPTGEKIRRYKVVFDGDENYFATEKTLTMYLGIKTELTTQYPKYVKGQEIVFTGYVLNFKDSKIANRTIALWRESSG